MKLAEKDRDGRLNHHRRVAVESEKDERERLLWMTVTDEGPIIGATAKADDQRSILTALEGGEWTQRKAIAAETGEPARTAPSGTWKSALKEAVAEGYVEHVTQRYRITAEGKERLTALGMEV